MRRAITVGRGFGKKSLEEAFNTAQAGDVVCVEPGEYNLANGYDIGSRSLTVKGLGEAPGEVIIRAQMVVQQNGQLTLENLQLESFGEEAGAIFAAMGAVTLSRCVVIGLRYNYPTLHGTGATFSLTACEIEHAEDEEFGIYVEEASHVTLTQCDVHGVAIIQSQIEIAETQLSGFSYLQNHAELQASSLYLIPAASDRWTLRFLSGSAATIEDLNIEEGVANIDVTDSALTVQATNVDDDHRIIVYPDATAEASVPGAEWGQMQAEGGEAAQAGDEGGADQTADANGDDRAADSAQGDQDTASGQAAATDDAPRAIDVLNAMIGLEQVKAEVAQFVNLAQFSKRREEQGFESVSQSLHSLFLGNPGTGKTTVARLVGRAMYEEGVLPTDHYVEVSRKDLVANVVGGTALNTQQKLEEARGGVLFVDEAYSLYQEGGTNWGQEAVDTILKYMEDHRDDLMIIFAGYTKEMNDFLSMNPGLASRAPNTFNFEDYAPAEIAQIGTQELQSKGFQLNQDLYEKAIVRAYQADVSHDNARWVRNQNEELIRIAAKNHPDVFDAITDADIGELTGGDDGDKADSTEQLLAQLDGMIGLTEVKAFVHDLVQQVKVNAALADTLGDAAKPTYHMVFAGNPGTGKTTVARLIAKLFYNLGILPRATVVEVSRPDLVAGYIGQSEAKTQKVIRDALGGVLFVDEAYQLTLEGQSGNDFGKQVVETFITALENQRDQFVAIFAGYTKEMAHFLDANPGLRSRIPLTIEFADYTPDEIGDIVVAVVGQQWQVNCELLKAVASQRYLQLPPAERANGRWARTFADTVVHQHKLALAKRLDRGEQIGDSARVIPDALVVALLRDESSRA
ncbi:AAA family ATPase [Lacticaseibacillus parakribbianus]|uniref:AAA family ATPase n=1 Tax=Lacticaseibacillus parakribbianus TaxID=2970927 RepID=UPI0021CB3B43|nr:AAA family ATPase [Lacticaseibacillus parakribbianus]